MPTPQRLAVLFAAPLARRDESGNLLPVDLLDFEAERQLLLDTFNEAGRLVEIRIEAATADLFQTLLTLGCRAVHYGGHGNRYFLAFENGQGEGATSASVTHSEGRRTSPGSGLPAGSRRTRSAS